MNIFRSIGARLRSTTAQRRAPAPSDQAETGILAGKVTFREVLTAILLMVPSAATTMLTYYGVSLPLSEQGGTILEKGQALAFAGTVGTFSWLGWFYLYGLLYRLRGKRLVASLVAGSIFVGSITAIDAPFNMLALGGGSAVQLTLVDTAVHYEARKGQVFESATIARQMLPAIDAQAKRFRELEDGEQRFGTYSGSSGPGKVSAGFGQIAALLEALSADLKGGLEASEALQGEIAEKFSALKADAHRPGPLRPRVERVSVAADALDDSLARLDQFDYRVSIEATLASLERIFPAPTVAGSTFEKAQNRELAAISAMAEPVAASLRGALEQLTDGPTVSHERVRPQPAIIAIRTKWRPLAFQWVAAIFIDLAPAALLVILIAAFREVEIRRDENAHRTHRSPTDSTED